MSVDDCSPVVTSSNWGMPWTRYGIALTTGRVAVGLSFPKGVIRLLGSKLSGYWEVTSLYAVARTLGAERILDLEGVYVELQALSSGEAAKLPRHAVEETVTEAFGFFRYHRLALPKRCWTGPVTTSGS